MTTIFVDSSAFYSLANRGDQSHARAVHVGCEESLPENQLLAGTMSRLGDHADGLRSVSRLRSVSSTSSTINAS